jgi:hypothetical protein
MKGKVAKKPKRQGYADTRQSRLSVHQRIKNRNKMMDSNI